MDRGLQEYVTRGDVSKLRKLVEQDGSILRQTVPGSLNTALHLAARFGHLELVQEILRTFPEMASMENAELETSLHVACREGHLEIVRLLLETDPWMAYKLNSRDETVLFSACERGRTQIVHHLLKFPNLLVLELDMATTSLHVAASSGNTEIARQILESRPDFAWKKNSQGCTPLHVACSKGHLDMARELLKLDSDLCLECDDEGHTPLHSAAGRGRINIIDEILSINLKSSEITTHKGQSILHLAVKYNQFEVVRYLTQALDTTSLLNVHDNDGNTVLHLATAGKLTAMVVYLLEVGVEVNALNRKGYTALDVIEADASNSGALAIIPALLEKGAKRCDQLSPGLTGIPQGIQSKSASRHNRPTPNQISPARHSHRHHRSNNRERKLELQNEGIRNARKTVTIVAVLVATITFAAGINPPGGFDQQNGKALRGNRAAFKVFLVCNIAALFISICVVNVHVSIIPYTRKTMMKLLSWTHKAMWLSTLFMTAAYIAAIWTIMPDTKSSRHVLVELALIGGGCSVIVFVGLMLMLARHWRNKYKWRKAKCKKTVNDSPNSSVSRVRELEMKINQDMSSNSDVDSSDHGYHLY
ncbi:ankyrin repeat-containing protein At5g02620-like [Andrographis paniculata]|uniref:ankyrin repeat-containing protein At5g02620-like n=1 Tax=Andrographis paniculata TaxID=175694 RepID=UPI0021E8785F|nr:ankyrin repeat-containing protein At5g02620-like [Andrographis paniculata]